MAITVAQLESLRQKLQDLPAQDESKHDLTKQEAIARMAGDLAKLQQRGYSMEDIANILTTGGLPITGKALKTCLSRARSTTKSRRKHHPSQAQHDALTTAPGSGNAPTTTSRRNGIGNAEIARPVNTSVNKLVSTPVTTSETPAGHEARGAASDTRPIQSQPGSRSSGFTPRADSPNI